MYVRRLGIVDLRNVETESTEKQRNKLFLLKLTENN